MKRFYVSFALLLLIASASLTGLLTVAAQMRGGGYGALASMLAGVSFVALAASTLLLVRIMIVLARPRAGGNEPEGGSL